MLVLTSDSITKREKKEMEFFGYFSEGVIILKGPAGAGKTMWMVAIAYNLKRYYGKPIILDCPAKPEGQPRPGMPELGDYSYMDDVKFREELSKIGKVNTKNEGAMNEAAEEVTQRMGLKLDNAVIGWDEAYKKLDARRCSSAYVLAHGYYLQIWRHFHNTIVLCTPRFDMIDSKRGLNQVTVELTCSANFRVTPTRIIGPRDPNKWLCRAHGIDRFTMRPLDMSLKAIEWGNLYDSWAPLAIREQMLRGITK